jgi:hypothetical protein
MHALIASFFLQGGLALMQTHPSPEIHGFEYWRYDPTVVSNPYGVVAAGFEHDWGRWNVSLEGRHMSSMSTHLDYGTNTLDLSVRVHPFQ